MLYFNDFVTKSRLELIYLLIADLIQLFIDNPKEAKLIQHSTLLTLLQVGLLSEEKEEVEQIIQDLIQLCEMGMAANNSHAMWFRGLLYRYGLGGLKDFARAIPLFEQAITMGNTNAMISCGGMYQEGEVGRKNYTKAAFYYKQALNSGNSNGMLYLGLMHSLGLGCIKNARYAIELYDNASIYDNPGALSARGSKLHAQKRYAEAIVFFERAMMRGCIAAICNRALMHRFGHGGSVNLAEAIRLYDLAIKLGSTLAIVVRAAMHQSGQGGDVNIEEAIRLLDLGIKMDDSHAMSDRALMYEQGQGSEVNYTEAIKLYDQSIAHDNIFSMNNRAKMHLNGHGGPIDFVKSARLFRQAAAQELTISLDNLTNHRHIPLFNYHYLMHQNNSIVKKNTLFENWQIYKNNIAQVVDLMIANDDLVTEFMEYDCQYPIINSLQNIDLIKNVIDASAKDKKTQNKLYISAIIGLDCCEKELVDCEISETSQIRKLKETYLHKINILDLKDETLLQIMQIVIDTWYSLSNEGWTEEVISFTQYATQFLSQSMYKLALSQIVSTDLLHNIALILVKNMYGNVDISLNAVSAEQIMLLIALCKCPEKPTIEKVDQLFHDVGLIIEDSLDNSLTEESKLSLVAISGISGFFYNKETLGNTTTREYLLPVSHHHKI